MKYQALKFLLLCGIIFPICAFDQETIEYFEWLAEEFRVLNHFPGLGLAIVHNGEAYKSYSNGFGQRDRKQDLPVDKDTLFAIASVTKSITSILAAKVVSEKFPTLGEAALDTPVIHLVPQLNFTFIDKNRHESMTLRDMLAHRTCLEQPDFQLFMGGYEDPHDYIYRTRYAKEVCQFRSQYVYNNAVYDLAGKIIGMIAGRPFADIAKDFFNELGMTRSTFFAKDWNNEPNTAKAYYWTVDDPEPIKVLDPKTLDRFAMVEGTGGVLSCAGDMEKYITFHILKGKVGDKVILPENVLNWVYKPSMKNGNDDYGLGLGIGNWFDGTPFISHGGSIPPYEGLFTFLPSHGMGIYSVISGPRETQVAQFDLHYFIFDFLLTKSKTQTLNTQKFLPVFTDVVKNEFPPKKLPLTKKSEQSNENVVNFTGLFGNAYWGNIVIGWNGDAYTFAYGNGEYSHGFLSAIQNPLLPNHYWINWTSDMSYVEAWMGGIQPYFVRVLNNDTISLNNVQEFKRDAVRETFPVIPWE